MTGQLATAHHYPAPSGREAGLSADQLTNEQRAAVRAWTEQAAATFWWEAQGAAQRGQHRLAARIMAKRDEVLIAAQEQLGEVWV